MTDTKTTKNYILLIDDDRDYSFVWQDLPKVIEKHKPSEFLIARTSFEAIEIVKQHGIPCFVFLDHDLGIVNGQIDTTMNFVNYMVYELDTFPEYLIHSQNTVGVPNLISKIESFHKSKEL